MIIWVQRGELPVWYNDAIEANKGSNLALNNLKRLGIHASETAWVGTDFDAIIDNNGSIEELYLQAKDLVISNQVALAPSDSFLAQDLSAITANSL